MARDIWIDQIGQNRDFRVREWVGKEPKTLGTFASHEQAEAYIDELLAEDERAKSKQKGAAQKPEKTVAE